MREFFNHDLLVMLGTIFVWVSGSIILYEIDNQPSPHWSHDDKYWELYIVAWPIFVALTPVILLCYAVFWPAKKFGQWLGKKL